MCCISLTTKGLKELKVCLNVNSFCEAPEKTLRKEDQHVQSRWRATCWAHLCHPDQCSPGGKVKELTYGHPGWLGWVGRELEQFSIKREMTLRWESHDCCKGWCLLMGGVWKEEFKYLGIYDTHNRFLSDCISMKLQGVPQECVLFSCYRKYLICFASTISNLFCTGSGTVKRHAIL